jgi:hypothetical protein
MAVDRQHGDAASRVQDRSRPGDPGRPIVAEAAAILADEARSLTAGGVRALSTLLSRTGTGDADPAGTVHEQARALAGALVRALGEQPDRIAQVLAPLVSASRQPAESGETDGVLLLHAARPVPAGGVAQVPFRLSNDDGEPDECTVCATDLVGASGYRIPASHVRVSPQPARLPGGGSADVQIEIRVPSGTPAGHYTGLVQTDDGEAVPALIRIRVDPGSER